MGRRPRRDVVAPVPLLERAWRNRLGERDRLTCLFGGKALADAVSRYGLYAGATLAVVAVFLTTAPKLIARLHGST